MFQAPFFKTSSAARGCGLPEATVSAGKGLGFEPGSLQEQSPGAYLIQCWAADRRRE